MILSIIIPVYNEEKIQIPMIYLKLYYIKKYCII